MHHPYRRNKKLFRKNVSVRALPPVYLTGGQIEAEIDHYGAQETVKRGGNWHTPRNMPDGYGEHHHWHKKSIFWDLPYWKDHLLRHNLDVMHIEKNFFDNIMYTILNVAKKTKDSKNSRMDLPAICSRIELHITDEGEVPFPIFRLKAPAKAALFKWVKDEVKFPDGYVSNLSKCVEDGTKFSGMKSHDCHVFMQRLLPFALKEIIDEDVNEALAGIGVFFRDLSTRTLMEQDIQQLEANIPILLCNLEKIFPPAFFDVMEHLPVHLPHEAALGGPVQYRWMYPFERFMKELKGKAKNLARVEGSIIAGSLTQEISNFTSYYFAPKVRTRKRAPRRYDDGGVAQTYAVEGVPEIFSQIGRLAGQLKEVWWSSAEDRHCAHTYIVVNCEEMRSFESLFVDQVRESIEGISDDEINKRKDQHFIPWLKTQVDYDDPFFPPWFHDLLQGPISKITTAPMFCTRGYAFHAYEYGRYRTSVNYGVCVKGEIDFYGIIQEIIEVEFAGLVGMKCVLFKCDWFDPTIGIGVRSNKLGVVDVNAGRRYNKFEPFILASQADQVSFISYPRLMTTGVTWLSAIRVKPRGRIEGVQPLQQDLCSEIPRPNQTTNEMLLIDGNNQVFEDIPYDDAEEDNENEEFGETDNLSTDSSEASDDVVDEYN